MYMKLDYEILTIMKTALQEHQKTHPAITLDRLSDIITKASLAIDKAMITYNLICDDETKAFLLFIYKDYEIEQIDKKIKFLKSKDWRH